MSIIIKLDGCPKDWDEAKLIQEKLNENIDEDTIQPKWNWDCNFKLDYDGPLLNVSSRFYPPIKQYGEEGWDGTVYVSLLDKQVGTKQFNCKTLEELQKQVNEYIKSIHEKISKVFE